MHGMISLQEIDAFGWIPWIPLCWKKASITNIFIVQGNYTVIHVKSITCPHLIIDRPVVMNKGGRYIIQIAGCGIVSIPVHDAEGVSAYCKSCCIAVYLPMKMEAHNAAHSKAMRQLA